MEKYKSKYKSKKTLSYALSVLVPREKVLVAIIPVFRSWDLATVALFLRPRNSSFYFPLAFLIFIPFSLFLSFLLSYLLFFEGVGEGLEASQSYSQ